MFTPVLAKHNKSFNLVDTLSVGVDRIQRNFELMQRQVESWRQTQITDAQAKLILYSAFVDGELDAPKSLLPDVHRLYFEPEYPEFSPRTTITNGKAVFLSLTLNGLTHTINQSFYPTTKPSSYSFGVHFQMDGNRAGNSYYAWVDKLTFIAW